MAQGDAVDEADVAQSARKASDHVEVDRPDAAKLRRVHSAPDFGAGTDPWRGGDRVGGRGVIREDLGEPGGPDGPSLGAWFPVYEPSLSLPFTPERTLSSSDGLFLSPVPTYPPTPHALPDSQPHGGAGVHPGV